LKPDQCVGKPLELAWAGTFPFASHGILTLKDFSVDVAEAMEAN